MAKKPVKKKDGSMRLTGHLAELRSRLVVCIIAVVAVFLLALNKAEDIVLALTDLGSVYGYQYVFLAPQELLMQYIKIALVASVCLCTPLLMYEIWAFASPGLKKKENTLFISGMLSGLVCFIVGIIFAYKVMIPMMLYFLINVGKTTAIVASISIENYIGFLLTVFVIFGVVFEMPVLTVIMTSLGFLKPSWMKSAFRYIIVLIFFVAAVITPPDVVSQVLVAVSMIALYGVSILLCQLVYSRRKPDADSEEEEAEA